MKRITKKENLCIDQRMQNLKWYHNQQVGSLVMVGIQAILQKESTRNVLFSHNRSSIGHSFERMCHNIIITIPNSVHCESIV